MLIPKVKAKQFEDYGFKRCKKPYDGLYYLCVSRGCKVLFISNSFFGIFDWTQDDPRIHKNANCKYRDKRDWLDITYDLIKAGLLESEYEHFNTLQKSR